MTARPILFTAPMVRALLEGRKTQTRRVVKPQPHHGPVGQIVNLGGAEWAMDDGDLSGLWTCPYGAPGDLLIVREAWSAEARWDFAPPQDIKPGSPIYYLAGGGGEEAIPECAGRVRSSIHMPRWASRLTLEITDVRVERLQSISEADAIAEGIEDVTSEVASGDPSVRFWKRYRDGGWNGYVDVAVGSYASLWTSINGPGSWAANPWVWALTFKVHQTNVDQLRRGAR